MLVHSGLAVLVQAKTLLKFALSTVYNFIVFGAIYTIVGDY
jgi:hypothetical protein